MNKRYRIQLPTPENCKAKGLKFEGQETRTRLWLIGVAQGVQFAAEACQAMVDEHEVHVTFNVSFAAKTYFYVDCDSSIIMENVKAHLKQYGCTVEELNRIPNCPSCNGQRELDGNGKYLCCFCGLVTA